MRLKLIKAEHPEKGIWYFTNIRKCAKFIDSADSNVSASLNRTHRPVKGWTLERIEDDNIICKYIDPELRYEIR